MSATSPPAVAADAKTPAPSPVADGPSGVSSPTLALVDAAGERVNIITIEDLPQLVQPFVGMKLVKRGHAPDGSPLRHPASIDIAHPGVRFLDADVRRVSAAGVEVFFWDGCDLVRWHEIREIVIRTPDHTGQHRIPTVYRVTNRARYAA